MSPKRIQLSRAKGWRLPANAVKVDRSTMWGNPYCVGAPIDMKMARRWGWSISPEGRKVVCEDASEAVARFTHCLHWDEAIHGYVRDQLKGRDLACWCAPGHPCHADALLAIANSDPAEIRALHDAIDQSILNAAVSRS
jgi:hypothetical protein